jgi:CDP-glucose 4,6-dehydratase
MHKKFQSTYRNRKVLVTGHTGFKGSWLSIWLKELGADVVGYALDPKTDKDNFVVTGLSEKIKDIRGDIRGRNKLKQVFKNEKPEIVFHLAAQPLVFLSYEDPLETLETNIIGTANVLEAIRQTGSVHTGIMITSDKCYENREIIWGYRENDPMGGHDPYSASKGSGELVIDSYRKSFFGKNEKAIASARAGNVVGGGDWSKYRLIPDIVRAIEAGQTVELRNPRATRPWQHVLEPLGGYLMLGTKIMEEPEKYAEAWNFGPYPHEVKPVQAVVNKMIRYFGKGQWKDISQNNLHHEAKLLTLDITKALTRLGWKPALTLDETIQMTVEWYKNYNQGVDMYELCKRQIEEYMNALNTDGTDYTDKH